MLDFVFIFGIFFEIIITAYCTIKLVHFEKKVTELNKKIIMVHRIIFVTNNKIKKTIKKINKVMSFITNKKLLAALRYTKMTVDIIQTLLLIRSLKIMKGIKKVDFKVVRTLIYAQAFKHLLKQLAKAVYSA